MSGSPDVPDTDEVRKLILFVAGKGVNSTRAMSNLEQVCEDRLEDCYELEVVDVLKDFSLALEYGIMVTPALVVKEPAPRVTVLGDLSDTDRLMKALRLK